MTNASLNQGSSLRWEFVRTIGSTARKN